MKKAFLFWWGGGDKNFGKYCQLLENLLPISNNECILFSCFFRFVGQHKCMIHFRLKLGIARMVWYFLFFNLLLIHYHSCNYYHFINFLRFLIIKNQVLVNSNPFLFKFDIKLCMIVYIVYLYMTCTSSELDYIL